MTRSRFICCCLCALQLALSPAAGAWTQQRLAERFGLNGTEIRPDALLDRRASKMTPAQAAREAQRRYGGGKVLSVDESGDGYKVKLLRDGDVRVVFISGR